MPRKSKINTLVSSWNKKNRMNVRNVQFKVIKKFISIIITALNVLSLLMYDVETLLWQGTARVHIEKIYNHNKYLCFYDCIWMQPQTLKNWLLYRRGGKNDAHRLKGVNFQQWSRCFSPWDIFILKPHCWQNIHA